MSLKRYSTSVMLWLSAAVLIAGTARPTVAGVRTGLNAARSKGPRFVAEAKVVSVSSGDMMTVIDENDVQHRVHLYATAAPAAGQPYAKESKKNLSQLVDKMIRVEGMAVESNGTIVAKVYDADNQYVNLVQISTGMAWHHAQRKASPELTAAQNEARNAKRGLWSEPNPVPPWQYRQQKKSTTTQETNP